MKYTLRALRWGLLALVLTTVGANAVDITGGGGPGVPSNGNPALVTQSPGAPAVTADNAQTQLVLKASPTTATGGVKYFHAENATTTGGYCILYNAVAAPAPGALTAGLVLDFQLLPASGYCDVPESPPVLASVGAVVLITSAATPFTYTTGVITAAIKGLAQ